MFVKHNVGGHDLYFALKDKVAYYEPQEKINTKINYEDEQTDKILSFQPGNGPIIYQGYDMDEIFKTGKKMLVKSIVRQPANWDFEIILE